MRGERHIVVTGAKGYIGSRVAARLLAHPEFLDARVTLVDLEAPTVPADPRVRALAADLTSGADLDRMLDGRADVVLHIAGVLGGAAERDYALSRRVNLEATLNLMERLRDPERPPRLVFASSVAVFGPPLPALIDDETHPMPLMNYGAHKRMVETAIEQFSARGWIDGLAPRLSGIVAHPNADARMKSAFLNTLFFDYAAGRDIVLPVSPEGTTWLVSVPACVDMLLHAATLPRSELGARRAFTLPTQCVKIGDLMEALGRRFPHSETTVTYRPDAALEEQFARLPPITTRLADALGFRHDGNLATLVERAIATA